MRECQFRSVREQQIISGRDWLLVTTIVQVLTALFPFYRWISSNMLPASEVDRLDAEKFGIAAAFMFCVSLIFFILWIWGKIAPYRAAVTAMLFFLCLQLSLAINQPQHMFDNLPSKVMILLGLLMAVRTGYRRRHSA